MSKLVEGLAEEVVAAFQAELDETAREQISGAQLERLELLVQDAVRAGIHNAVERMERVVRELRSDAGAPPIEL